MGPIKHKALINVDLGEGYGNLKCVRTFFHSDRLDILTKFLGARQRASALHLARQCSLWFPLRRPAHYDEHCTPLQIP